MNAPKFTVPTWPIDPLDPWKGTKTDGPEFAQGYVTRDLKSVEVVCEVDFSKGKPQLADCFDLNGRQVILTLDENIEILDDWISWMERRVAKGDD